MFEVTPKTIRKVVSKTTPKVVPRATPKVVPRVGKGGAQDNTIGGAQDSRQGWCPRHGAQDVFCAKQTENVLGTMSRAPSRAPSRALSRAPSWAPPPGMSFCCLKVIIVACCCFGHSYLVNPYALPRSLSCCCLPPTVSLAGVYPTISHCSSNAART